MRIIDIDGKYNIAVNHFLPDGRHHIFNSAKYFRLHQTGRAYFYQLCSATTTGVLATVHFTETAPGQFKSPATGTFGGFCTAKDVPLDALDRFVVSVEKHLLDNEAREIHIALAPAIHDLQLFSISFNLLARRGYKVIRHDLNHHLEITSAALPDRMEHGNQKRYRKCLREGFEARRLDASRYADAYAVIASNRQRRGFPITMSFPQIMEMVRVFGERIKMFAVYREELLVASAICIDIDGRILYVFYWGDIDNMQSHSPITLLAAQIYEYCQTDRYEILDIGVSTVAGDPNYGLVRFKRSLGCTESLKLSLAKSVAQ